MKYNFVLKYSCVFLILLIFSACQSVKIKNDTYKVSTSIPEMGSIGVSKSVLGIQNDFKVRTLPQLKNEIRLSVEVVPFTKKLAKRYDSKSAFNQSQLPLHFIDSLSIKPELAIVKILDVAGYAAELNAEYNEGVYNLLYASKEFQVVSSVGIVFSADNLAKIREADAYYLANIQEKKYTISLYKSGKKIDTLEMSPSTLIVYTVRKFCWSQDSKGKSYIADITEDYCKGLTKSAPKSKKKVKNLYKI